jgi:hypothetical protein
VALTVLPAVIGVSGTAMPEAAQAVSAFGQLMLVALWTVTLMGPRLMQIGRGLHLKATAAAAPFGLSLPKSVGDGKNIGEEMESSQAAATAADAVAHLVIQQSDPNAVDQSAVATSGNEQGADVRVQPLVASNALVPPLWSNLQPNAGGRTDSQFLSPSALHAAKYMPGRADQPSSLMAVHGSDRNPDGFSILPFAAPAPTQRFHPSLPVLPPSRLLPFGSFASASVGSSGQMGSDSEPSAEWDHSSSPHQLSSGRAAGTALTARNLIVHFPLLQAAVLTDEAQLALQRRGLRAAIAQQRRTLFEPLAHALRRHASELYVALKMPGDHASHETDSGTSSQRNNGKPSSSSSSASPGSSHGHSPLSLLPPIQQHGALSSHDRQHYLRSAVAYLRAVDAAVCAQLTCRSTSPSTSPDDPSLPASPSATRSPVGRLSWAMGSFPPTLRPAVAPNPNSPSEAPSSLLSSSSVLLESSGVLDVLLAHHWSAEAGVGFGPLAARLEASADASTADRIDGPTSAVTAGHASSARELSDSTLALLAFVDQLQRELEACVAHVMHADPESMAQKTLSSSSSSSGSPASSSSSALTSASTPTASSRETVALVAQHPQSHAARTMAAPSPSFQLHDEQGEEEPGVFSVEMVAAPLSYQPPSIVELDPVNTPRHSHRAEDSLSRASDGGGGFVLHYESSSSMRAIAFEEDEDDE